MPKLWTHPSPVNAPRARRKSDLSRMPGCCEDDSRRRSRRMSLFCLLPPLIIFCISPTSTAAFPQQLSPQYQRPGYFQTNHVRHGDRKRHHTQTAFSNLEQVPIASSLVVPENEDFFNPDRSTNVLSSRASRPIVTKEAYSYAPFTSAPSSSDHLVPKNLTSSQRLIQFRFSGGSPSNAGDSRTPKSSDVVSNNFTLMRIDQQSGDVYVAAVNAIYHLNPDLKLLEAVSTGPKMDNAECVFTDMDCGHGRKRSSNSIPKALVIDAARTQLIECTTLYNGQCQLYNLYNLTSPAMPAQQSANVESVVINNANTAVAAFIAPGPSGPHNADGNANVLYVGTYTYPGPNMYDYQLPAVSSRSLQRDTLFTIASTTLSAESRIDVSPQSKSAYPVDYVYGFAADNYAYFVTVQPRSLQEIQQQGAAPFVTKIVRLCQSDALYQSYTEIQLECRGTASSTGDQNDKTRLYNLAQAAYLGKAGSELADALSMQVSDDVLFVVFSESNTKKKGLEAKQPTSKGALCVYAMSHVKMQFTENIQRCHRGEGQAGIDYMQTTHPCVSTQLEVDDSFCGVDVNTPLNGSIPIVAHAALTSHNVRYTSIASTVTYAYTVAFIGTERGTLKKAIVYSDSRADEYSEILIALNNKPILADMFLSPARDHVYAMTRQELYKVKVHDCTAFTTCSQCLEASDPYCGWCTFENKCSLRQNCAVTSSETLFWQPFKTGKCTSISRVEPDALQITAARTLTLTIDHMPDLVAAPLACVFYVPNAAKNNVLRLETPAQRTASGATCSSPQPETLPMLKKSARNPSEAAVALDAAVSIMMSTTIAGSGGAQTAIEFQRTNLTFFNCAVYSTCSACVSGRFACDWCVRAHKCTSDALGECRQDFLVNAQVKRNDYFELGRYGPAFCPRIEPLAPQSLPASTTSLALGTAPNSVRAFIGSHVLVPSGTSASVQVRLVNVQNFQTSEADGGSQLRCNFITLGRGGARTVVQSVDAQLLTLNVLECGKVFFRYDGAEPNVTALLSVTWRRDSGQDQSNEDFSATNALDNPNGLHVLMYKCENMASNCGTCLAHESHFGCGWCATAAAAGGVPFSSVVPQQQQQQQLGTSAGQQTSSCQVREQCVTSEQLFRSSQQLQWLDKGSICPNPIITSFTPRKGPVAGGTDLTIRGINLGQTYDDIARGVRIGNRPCMPYRHRYVTATEIVCRIVSSSGVGNDGQLLTNEAKIVVNIAGGEQTAISAESFLFVRPEIHNITPSRGPRDGGTNITITGTNLDTGSLRRAQIGTLLCNNLTIFSSARATCITSDAPQVGLLGFEMQFDVDETGGGITARLERPEFEYVPNPEVHKVLFVPDGTAEAPAVSGARGFFAGGTRLLVTGQYFDTISQPKMIVYYNNREFVTKTETSDQPPCQMLDSSRLVCRTPRIDEQNRRRRALDDDPIAVAYGFVMDGAQNVRNISRALGEPFMLYPNPRVTPFADGIRYLTALPSTTTTTSSPTTVSVQSTTKQRTAARNESTSPPSMPPPAPVLIITGDNFDLAAGLPDVLVTVGGVACNVIKLSRDEIICTPPALEAMQQQNDGSNLHWPVIVKIGNYLAAPGVVSYDMSSALHPANNMNVGTAFSNKIFDTFSIVQVLGFGFVVFAIIFIGVVGIFVAAYRRKSSESTRVLKNMQDQVDALEVQVAAECKEAFAELQTDITDWAGDLLTAGIPVRDYRTYVFKVLFPNSDSHPLILCNTTTSNYEHHTANSFDGNTGIVAGILNGGTPASIHHNHLHHSSHSYLNHQHHQHLIHQRSASGHANATTTTIPAALGPAGGGGGPKNADAALKLFHQLMLNKSFLLLFIRTLESNRYFSLRDRVNVASLIMICLQSDMVYCTDILKTLLAELIARSCGGGGGARTQDGNTAGSVTNGKTGSGHNSSGGTNPKLLLRRNESVSEKMLSAWFAFLLYRYLRDTAGEPLYMLFRAIQLQVDKGPVDAVTSEAKYSLSEEKLIRQKVDHQKLVVYVSCIYNTQTSHEYPVKVLDCDTIGQAKEKALDVIYRNCPYSKRPKAENLDLEWRTGSGSMLLQDEDKTCLEENFGGGVRLRKLNTLMHYHVNDGAVFVLVPRHSSIYALTMMSDRSSDKSSSGFSSSGYHQNHVNTNGSSKNHLHLLHANNNAGLAHSPAISRGHSPLYSELNENQHNNYNGVVSNTNGTLANGGTGTTGSNSGVKAWHLVKPSHDHQDLMLLGQNGGGGAGQSAGGGTIAKRNGASGAAAGAVPLCNSKLVSEVYLTRLLTTKKTLKKFIDDLFEIVFAPANRNSAFPLAIKYLFDFLDEQAMQHDIVDAEVMHTWKSNSLPLRFWVNLIKNPNFIFDIHKSNTVDACLSVVAQALMDSCSTSDLRLTKDSPSSKLLFAKDISNYKELVKHYYEDIQYSCPTISDQEFNAILAEESRLHRHEFNIKPALQELYNYCFKHNDALMSTLEENELAQKNKLAHRLYQVHHLMRADSRV